ncbi:MAG: SpoIIE family protein phosphatase [Planctomycetota bacterium]
MRHAQLVSGRISDTPFGIQEEAIYGELEVKLRSGDMVLSFSDAVTESKSESGRPLGAQGVLGLVHELDATTPGSIIPQLTARLRELHPGNLQDDDVTLLLMQSTGGGASLKNNLLAPFRLLGPVTDRTQIH